MTIIVKNTSTDIYFLLNLPALTSSSGYRTIDHLKSVVVTPHKFPIESLDREPLTLLDSTPLQVYIQTNYPELLL